MNSVSSWSSVAGGRARLSAAIFFLLVAVGCAGNEALQRGDLEVERGNLDTAIAYYQEVLLEDPGNTEAKIALAHAKLRASQQHEQDGVRMAEAGQLEQAIQELQLAIRLDPGNEMAVTRLGKVERDLAARRRAEQEQMTPTELALEEARAAAPILPELEPQVGGPISFDFRDVAVSEIYRTLAQIGGLNVLFESSFVDDSTTFRVDGVDFDDALRLLTTAHGHFFKVLSPNSFLVIPDDITKRREYADQVMQTFYLSNADAATIEQQIRAILTTQRVSSNPDLNSITIRDTPEAVNIAGRFIGSADKAVGEILLEVEVLEVSREVVANYGLALEPFSGAFQIPPQTDEAGNSFGSSLSRLDNLTSSDIFVSVPTLFYQFLRTTNDFKLVAQPKLRATEGETTTLLIGEEVPVVTTTFNPASTLGGNVVPISSTEYRPTGISLSVLPRVHFNSEITLEIEIQVSAVTATATVASVGDLPVFTTREVAGSIRLRDGETNVIAGLLQDNDIRRRRGIIGLDNVPVVGDALSNTESTRDQTDVIISITPHLLRSADITPADLQAVYVGTETTVTGSGFGAALSRPAAATGVSAGPPGAAQQQAQIATLALLPADHVVRVGEEFALDVTIEGADDLYSAGLQLQFDPTVIEFVDYFEGGFIDRDGVEATMQVTGAGAGIVRLAMTRLASDAGVSGAGSLVTLVFRGAGVGSSPIQISSAALRRAAGDSLAAQMLPADVEVRPARD